MAELLINTENIQHNIRTLGSYFEKKGIIWSLITKVFSGDKEFLRKVLTDEIIESIDSIGDSRLTSLKNLREVNPEMRTIYIKPPAEVYADEVVRLADISLNSSLSTIKALNEAAGKIGRVHKVIIMIELGELREGVERADVIEFYEQVFELPHIEVIGLGSNLGCMYGVEPTYDKLLQLNLYKQLISAKFNRDLPLVSGGTSITLPLLENGSVPAGINHFRIGEAAFFGVSPLDNKPFLNLRTDTFEFRANIIELAKKKMVPEGVISDASIGHTAGFDDADTSEHSIKAILDFGILDVDHADLHTEDEKISFVGITSDMIVIDVGDNLNEDGSQRYKVNEQLTFQPSYLGVARLLNSKFIDKVYV